MLRKPCRVGLAVSVSASHMVGRWFASRSGHKKFHKIVHNSMKNKGSTPILINLVRIYPRNIRTKFETYPCSGSREEVKKTNKVHTAADNDDRHRVMPRVTLTR